MADRKPLTLPVEFIDLKQDEKSPNIALYLLDTSGQIEKKVSTIKDGKLTIDLALKKGERKIIAVGPDIDVKRIRSDMLLQFRIEDQLPLWEEEKVIKIPREWWSNWSIFRVCVSGRVRRCWPFFIEIWPLKHLSNPLPIPSPFYRLCRPICNGVVEVYERECCCQPWIFPAEILKKLKDLVRVWPPLPWPPPPPDNPGVGPDPLPIDRVALRNLKEVEAFGTIPKTTEFPMHLLEDIKVLENLPQIEAIKYVKEKPYLWSPSFIHSVNIAVQVTSTK
jgi:hypothetical protein